jgi:DNA gyrase/topoisomerase IV subunit B
MFEKGSKLDINYAKNWADLTSYLNPGLTIHVMSERAELTYYHDSLSEYLEKVYEDNKATSYHDIELSTTFDIEGRSSTLDIALGFTDSDATQLDFFTNGVKNPEGGKHYDAFWKAMKDVLSNYSLRNQSFTLNELREGVLGIVHLGLYQPQFASQTKEKLSDVRVYEPMYEFMCEVLTKHFNKNKAIAKEICQRASAISELKKKASATRQALLGIKKKAKTLTPTKLAGVVGRAKPEDIELIICEGDSAKGGLTLGRDKTTQMVLALKGKPLNAMKTDDAKVLASEEVANILSSIGYNPALKEPTSKLSCGKIILMSDADDDGFHINSLVISLLYKYQSLIDAGNGNETVFGNPDITWET